MMRYKLLILLLLFASVLSAQKVYVRGYVLNEDKRAVEFATVQIKETAIGTITNEKDILNYRFSNKTLLHCNSRVWDMWRQKGRWQ